VLSDAIGDQRESSLAARHLADLEELGHEVLARLHVDAGREYRHDNGFGPTHQFVELGAVNARRRIDHQNIGGPGYVPHTVFEGSHPSDGRQISGSLRQPIETGLLRIVIRDADLLPKSCEEYRDIRG
jgi:hypothetical protein